MTDKKSLIYPINVKIGNRKVFQDDIPYHRRKATKSQYIQPLTDEFKSWMEVVAGLESDSYQFCKTWHYDPPERMFMGGNGEYFHYRIIWIRDKSIVPLIGIRWAE